MSAASLQAQSGFARPQRVASAALAGSLMLAVCGAATPTPPGGAAPAPSNRLRTVLGAAWAGYKQVFIQPDGRVVEPTRGDVTTWLVTLACVRGLVQKHADFLRTAKSKEGRSLIGALRASRAETLLVVASVAGAVAMLVRSPSLATIVLALLLLFEAFVYSNAPWASLAAEESS
jgi:hypothetical protein